MSNSQRLILVAALLAAPLAWAGDGVTGLLRSITGALNSNQTPPPPQPAPTAVLGVRGIDEVAQNSSGAKSAHGLQLIEGWVANTAEAEQAAKAKGLAARPVTLANAGSTSAADAP